VAANALACQKPSLPRNLPLSTKYFSASTQHFCRIAQHNYRGGQQVFRISGGAAAHGGKLTANLVLPADYRPYGVTFTVQARLL
jgi:hypothetical protein